MIRSDDMNITILFFSFVAKHFNHEVRLTHDAVFYLNVEVAMFDVVDKKCGGEHNICVSCFIACCCNPLTLYYTSYHIQTSYSVGLFLVPRQHNTLS